MLVFFSFIYLTSEFKELMVWIRILRASSWKGWWTGLEDFRCVQYTTLYIIYLSTVLYFSFRFWTVKYLQLWTNIWKPLTVKQRTCQWSMWGASSHQFIRYCLSLVVTSHDILDLVVIEEDRSAVVDFDLLRFKKLHVFYCCLGCLI